MIQPKKLAFVKYIEAIKVAPPETYNWRIFTTVACFALAGQAKGWDERAMVAVSSLQSFQTTFGITPKTDRNTIPNLVSLPILTGFAGAMLSIYILGNLISTFSYGNLGALYFGQIVTGVGFGSRIDDAWFNVCMLGGQTIGTFVCYGCILHINPKSDLQRQIPFFVQTFVPATAIWIYTFFMVLETSRRSLESMDALFEGYWWERRKNANVGDGAEGKQTNEDEKTDERMIETVV
ncbi:hypothetical protein BDZ45DRAFT_743408 [Acephala macrosclerotiorum]|nr:hypothetical protein BDZ45DRAFT_743408 [Acephala macrosclerotiorum]